MISETLESIKQIEELYSSLIIESNYIRNNNVITWPDFYNYGRKNLYAREYKNLLENRQYTFLFWDESFMQVYYEFNEAQAVNEAKLCYYPFPVRLNENIKDIEEFFEQNQNELISRYYYDLWNIMGEEIGVKTTDNQRSDFIEYFNAKGYQFNPEDFQIEYFDEAYGLSNYSHFRMDYDANVMTHNKCEFQFGAIKSIRLPIDRILEPLIFFDFIVRYFFKDYYAQLTTFKYKKAYLVSKAKCSLVDIFRERSFFNTIR